MRGILVIGATGQLGLAAVQKLAIRSSSIRALVRSKEGAFRLERLGIETVFGDLSDPPSLARACTGMDVVVATANAAVPTRPTDTFETVDGRGYRNLIQAAVDAGVRRLVYTSAPVSKYNDLCPLVRFKRETEEAIGSSGLDAVIFRADIFMDVAFIMLGSTIPIRGSDGATVLRPFGFVNNHVNRIKNDIERKRISRIPGDGTTRHAFICIDDMAEYLVAAVSAGNSGTYAVGGPEALTFLDIVKIYERVLGIALSVRKTPSRVFRMAATVMRPFSAAGANLMALNYIAATEDSFADPGAAGVFGVRLTSAEAFIRRKASMAAHS